ncbi:MAG: hypothetical protein IPG45_30135 [Deltaproteobacteria bacterium]|nr:hypothetical protein [Deltaproteobacteria bacterium]
MNKPTQTIHAPIEQETGEHFASIGTHQHWKKERSGRRIADQLFREIQRKEVPAPMAADLSRCFWLDIHEVHLGLAVEPSLYYSKASNPTQERLDALEREVEVLKKRLARSERRSSCLERANDDWHETLKLLASEVLFRTDVLAGVRFFVKARDPALAGELVLDHVRALLDAGRFADLEQQLEELDLGELDSSTLVMLLVATNLGREHLPKRGELWERVRQRLLEIKSSEKEVAQLVDGLK